MRRSVLAVAVLATLVLSASASAKPVARYFPKSHASCHAHYVRKTIRVRERRHGHKIRVRRVECVRIASKPKPKPVLRPTQPPTPTAAPTPTIHYTAKVDPSFTQNPSNPLSVVYSFSADATQTIGNATTDLAAADQLPAGILNLYTTDEPGQSGESLICAIDVGGSTNGGSCPITYATTGSYQVTTQYVLSSANSVTQTETETISPYTTTTSESIVSDPNVPCTVNDDGTTTTSQCGYIVTSNTTDQNGTSPSATTHLQFRGTAADGNAAEYDLTAPAGQTICHVVVANQAADDYAADGWMSQTDVSSPDCAGNQSWSGGNHTQGPGVRGNDVATWDVVSSFAGMDGWLPSGSGVQTVTP